MNNSRMLEMQILLFTPSPSVLSACRVAGTKEGTGQTGKGKTGQASVSVRLAAS